MKKGKNLKIFNKRSVFIGKEVIIGNNVTIYENNRIEGNTIIKDGATILPNCYILDCVIDENTTINHSQAEKSIIGKSCSIGPFARLRPNTVLENNVKIGNFVEVKNSHVKNGTKISHLAYVGDANVGEDCNIGCGAIFVNYDGNNKHRSIIGNRCFIGSNCNVIAPVKIDNDVYVCAGTTVTNDHASGDFVIGRVRESVKANRAYEYLKKEKK